MNSVRKGESRSMKRILLVLVLLVVAFGSTGCYFWDDVATNQVGLQLDRNEIKNCVPSGVYTDSAWFADLKVVNVATITFQVTDPEVATQDNQLVGIGITIQARRKADCQSVSNMLTNWSTLLDDDTLVSTITATAMEGIKVGTRQFTLMQLLDDRNGLSDAIANSIESDASKYNTEVVNVTVNNIALAVEYAAKLQERALLTAEIDLELRRQELIRQTASNDKLEQDQRTQVLEQKLLAEQAQTEVDVEIASREGKKTAAAMEVYSLNPQAYELARLDRLALILGDKATVYFVPEGTDLTMLYGAGGVVPLVSE